MASAFLRHRDEPVSAREAEYTPPVDHVQATPADAPDGGAARHDTAAQTHEEAANAALERRNADHERRLGELERDRAELIRSRGRGHMSAELDMPPSLGNR
jgi:hypothetical protein